MTLQYTTSLLNLIDSMNKKNISYMVDFLGNESLIPRARNRSLEKRRTRIHARNGIKHVNLENNENIDAIENPIERIHRRKVREMKNKSRSNKLKAFAKKTKRKRRRSFRRARTAGGPTIHLRSVSTSRSIRMLRRRVGWGSSRVQMTRTFAPSPPLPPHLRLPPRGGTHPSRAAHLALLTVPRAR